MRFSLLLFLCACHGAATHTPLAAPASKLPASLESCAQLGAVDGGRTCAIYDVSKQAFSPEPDGTPEDALARRAFLYERWLDLYNAPEKQPAVRRLRSVAAPGTPETVFGSLDDFEGWDDQGDSAGFTDTALNAAIFHYVTTGTDADYARFEAWVRGQLRQWDATGMDGYLARWHFAGVAPGTQLPNDRAMDFWDDGAFPIPAAQLDKMPAYYRDPGVKPSWRGHTSIDAYSGSMNTWPLAFRLLKDADLKARMARHYGCFLKRLRIFKVINLSQNTQLQQDLARYLTSTVLKQDPDDPDLSKVDQVWGFYLPQYNKVSAATYPAECPAHLATDATPEEIIDVTQPGFDAKLIALMLRQVDGQDAADSIDFAFFPSVRAGDAVMLDSYALGAYHMTGDEEFLHWRTDVLIKAANAAEIERTVGEFNPPRPCRSYYRTPNVYTAHFMRSLIDTQTDWARMIWTRKFAGREVAGLRDALFETMTAGVTGEPDMTIVRDLLDLGGAPGHLDDPRRNYAVDLGGAVATKPELDTCSQPVTILGIPIPLGAPDPNVRFVSEAPPVMQRPPDNWIWEKDPFAAVRSPWDAGRQQYTGLDLLEPYWIARYYGLLPDSHLVLAWQ